MGIGPYRGGPDLLIAGVKFTVCNILPNGPGKEKDILLHNANITAQRALLEFTDIDTVNFNTSPLNIVKTGNQVTEGGFTSPGGSDQGHGLPGSNVETNIFQDMLVLLVTEGNPI